MRCEEFSLCLRAGTKFTHRKFRIGVDPGAIIPTGFREIHRMIIAIGMQRAATRALRDHAKRDCFWPA